MNASVWDDNKWKWWSKNKDNNRAKFRPKSSREYNFYLFMRENGFRVDSWVLTTSSSYKPLQSVTVDSQYEPEIQKYICTAQASGGRNLSYTWTGYKVSFSSTNTAVVIVEKWGSGAWVNVKVNESFTKTSVSKKKYL